QPEGSNSKKKVFKDKKQGKNTNQGTNQKNHEQDTNKQFEKIEKLLEKLQSATNLSSVNATSEPKDLTQQTESDSEAFIFEVNALAEQCNQGSIYLDSGAGRTVVNQLSLLEDPKPVKKQINMFSNPVKLTHQGTFNFKGVKIYPVYYVPGGLVNFLSVLQLCNHGMKLISKSNLFIVKYGNRIVDTFHQEGNLFVSKLQIDSFHVMPSMTPDWHLNLGHPCDSYIKALLKEGHISGTFTESLKCPVCQQAKIKNCPHSKMLPHSNSPFFKIHMDTLQINPPTCKGHKYVLVLIDDLSRFNRTYVMKEKGEAEEYIKSYLREIKNKLGISLERGPPESPQTDGVAERFNKTLLSKVRCLLGQSNIPSSYWDETVSHASLLLNLLPHRYLGMKSPTTTLHDCNCSIEPKTGLNILVPFGINVTTKITNPSSKIEPRGEILRALTFEKYSDGLRLLNLETGKIRVSRDFTPTVVNPMLHESTTASASNHFFADNQVTNTYTRKSAVVPSAQQSKHYDYVPYYKQAPKNISSSISQDNIILGKRNDRDSHQLMLVDIVPYAQALSDPLERTEWQKAMDTEYNSLIAHNTGELVPYPDKPAKVIGGNHQEHMLHYYETWASVGRNETFKVMLSLVINFNYIPYQFNIETAFLHGKMDALVHVKQVKGYEVKGKENWVWRLKKSLYGTKQAPRMWKEKLTVTLNNLGLISAQSDESLFTNSDKSLLLHVHFDDGFIISKSESKIIKFISNLNSLLKLKFKKRPTQHLGYSLTWEKDKLIINQSNLISKLLRQFNMEDSNPVKTPCNGNILNELDSDTTNEPVEVTLFQQAIGTINYIAHHTQPDILFSINQLSRYSIRPGHCHWSALKHLLCYLKGTRNKCLIYNRTSSKDPLAGWADADYANMKDDRKSISGFIVLAFGNPVCWLSKKQSVVAQSTTEAEYISMNICTKQLRWLSYVFSDLGIQGVQPTLYNDNSGAVIISKQASLNANTKHIEVRYQYIRDCVMKKLVKVVQVSTKDMLADVLTKPLGVIKLQDVLEQLHLKDFGGVS
ncbi:hypothetical protein O181_077870, partial [Austropuccinia psidii MF-1]|nr:hypothetical protein [Austropuccinia psidii MF-1]